MAASTQTLVGVGVIDGITGAFTFTDLVSGSDYGPNFENITLEDTFDTERLMSQNGAVTEGIFAKNRRRRLTGKFVPKGTSRTNAKACAAAHLALTPLKVITTAGFDVAGLNGTWNYMGGATIELTREGHAICNIEMESQETAGTAGTFAGLAVIS